MVFIRLIRCHGKIIDSYNLHNIDLMIDGSMASRGTGEIKKYQWYGVYFSIPPLINLENRLKTLKFLKLTKNKLCK